jgi:hypothetical protein
VFEQILHIGIVLDVDVGIGMIVAGKERLQAQRVGRVIRADQHHVAEALIDEMRTAQGKRVHQELAQLRIRLHDAAQVRRTDLEQLARHRRARARAAAAGGDVDLARELRAIAKVMRVSPCRPGSRSRLAFGYDVEAADLTHVEDDFTGRADTGVRTASGDRSAPGSVWEQSIPRQLGGASRSLRRFEGEHVHVAPHPVLARLEERITGWRVA